MKERLASVPVLGMALRVHERFIEIRGGAISNGIALQAFLSIFPLLLVGIAAVGFLSAGDPSFTDDVIESLSLEGEAGEDIREAITNAEDSRQAASVVGFAGLLLSGLNLVIAVQRAVDSAWQTFGKGIVEKLRALLWLVGAAAVFVGSLGLSAALNFLPGAFAPLSVAVGLVVNVALFLWTFVWLGRAPVGWRAHLAGAVFCAIGFEILKIVGSVYVPRLVSNSSALYGSLGVVLALLAWLAFFGRVIVYGAVLNVIRFEDDHGTVSVPVEAPRVDVAVPVEANRAGAVVDRLER